MFGLFFFIFLTILLLARLNDILGMHIGHKADNATSNKVVEDNFVEEYIPNEESILEDKIHNISTIYRNFSKSDFLEKAKKVFELVFEAYAKGDKGTLRNLLAQRIFNAFSMAIDDRKSRAEKLEGFLVRFISADIIDASVTDDYMFITVKFITEQSNVLKSKSGETLEGNSDFVEKRTDVWVFERRKISPDPRWFLYEIKDQS